MIIEKIKRWFGHLSSQDENKRFLTPPYLFIILGIGVALMLISNLYAGTSSTSTDPSALPTTANKSDGDEPAFGQQSSKPQTMVEYEDHYENELRDVLEETIGISDVTVMVNLSSSEKKIVEKNESTQQQKTDETDSEGGTRKVTNTSRDEEVIILQNDKGETPYVVATEKPKVRGVVVVAEGVDHLEIKKRIIEAVTRVLDVGSHRVSVLPKKIKED